VPEQPKLRIRDIADRLNIQPGTWRDYVSRDQAPKPDGHFDLRTPYWFEATIAQYEASRPSNTTTAEPQRRRRYSPEFKAQILADYEKSGLSTKDFAKEHGLTLSMLNHWVHGRPSSRKPDHESIAVDQP
jgi:transposase-like protein